MNLAFLLHQTVCGAVASAGFGVLFNVSIRLLPWCALSGAVALAVRTSFVALGLSLEGSSFAGALMVSAAVELLRNRTDIPDSLLDVVGCIPMVPGSFAAKAIIGLFALATSSTDNDQQVLIAAAQYAMRLVFTTGAIGTGLAIPRLLLRVRATVPPC